jgi:hypothetical protein
MGYRGLFSTPVMFIEVYSFECACSISTPSTHFVVTRLLRIAVNTVLTFSAFLPLKGKDVNLRDHYATRICTPILNFLTSALIFIFGMDIMPLENIQQHNF